MESISQWVLAICGIALVGVIVDIILPEGEMQKYCRSVFGLIMLLVIISPLPKLINTDYNFLELYNKNAITIDENYITEGYKARLRLLERSCEAELEQSGYKNVKISITVDEYTENMRILSVYADVSNIEFTGGVSHTNYYGKVLDIIAGFLSITRSVVSGNG